MSTNSTADAAEIKDIRLHVGGLPPNINVKDVEERFRSFGQVQGVEIIPHKFETGTCRGFGYVSLKTSSGQLSKCMNILNGCSWKGGKLHISVAKSTFIEKLALRQEREGVSSGDGVMRKRKLTRMASNQSLVTDKNVEDRKGWRRGRYGRAVAILKIRRPNRELISIDPTHFKNNLEKLFGSVRPKPISKLSWTISDSDEISETTSYNYQYNQNQNQDIEILDEDEEEHPDEEVVGVDSAEVETIEPLVESTENDIILDESMETDPVCEPIEAVLPTEDVIEQEQEQEEADVIMEQVVEEGIASEKEQEEEMIPIVDSKVKQEEISDPKFEVNVNWNELFSKTAESSGFTLNFSTSNDPFKKTSEEVFQPQIQEQSQSQSEVEVVKKTAHNFATLFTDLNRITPTTGARFGMLLSKKEEMLADWRVERIDLKEDFKKKFSDGRKRMKKRHSGGRGTAAASLPENI